MKAKTTLTIAIGALVTLAVFGVFRQQRAAAQPEIQPRAAEEEFLAFGVFGITLGQTARLHAVAVGVAAAQEVELSIYDSHGNLLAQSTERLRPGRAATLALPFPEKESNRVEMYSVIRFINGPPRHGYVIGTWEAVDDVSGKTIFAIADPEG